MTDICLKRLRKEYRDIRKNPPAHIRAAPLENNTLEWHYVIEGVEGTPYANGWYHGVLQFPKDYPWKPPSIMMYTPSGRFKEATRLCLSMSDFHPELWNTSWTVSTILVGLQSFMNEDSPTAGSITTSLRTKRQLAQKSMQFNVKNRKFVLLFPELVEMHKKNEQQRGAAKTSDHECSEQIDGDVPPDDWSMDSILLLLGAILICIIAMVSVAKSEGS
mmetsp:Transcript_12876/g.21016  ORF Transcript_12876/g.21016 Transcript_12876/m.21016 type:complete len:218 (+) Transcript_12876:109-762(+)